MAAHPLLDLPFLPSVSEWIEDLEDTDTIAEEAIAPAKRGPKHLAMIGHDNIAKFMCYRIIHHASVQSHRQLFGSSALNSTDGWQSGTAAGNRPSGDRSKLHSQYQTGKAKTFQMAEGAGLVDVCCANLLLRLQGLLIKQWGAFSALRGIFILGVDRKSFWIRNS